jgi:hypothetical protein
MANLDRQLEGSLLICVTGDVLAEVGESVSEARITRQRNMVTRPANLATAEETEVPGTMKRMLTIDLFSDTTADSVWGILAEAIESDAGTIDFELTLNDDTVGSDNAVYSGTAAVPQLEQGGPVGELRRQSITCPITIWNTPDVTP